MITNLDDNKWQRLNNNDNDNISRVVMITKLWMIVIHNNYDCNNINSNDNNDRNRNENDENKASVTLGFPLGGSLYLNSINVYIYIYHIYHIWYHRMSCQLWRNMIHAYTNGSSRQKFSKSVWFRACKFCVRQSAHGNETNLKISSVMGNSLDMPEWYYSMNYSTGLNIQIKTFMWQTNEYCDGRTMMIHSYAPRTSFKGI